MHATPPNRRPTAEQAAARHREVRKHHQKQRKNRSEETPDKPEDVRLAHLRWRELQRLMRHRYGVVMPETDEARRDIEILIGYATLTGKTVRHQADLLAPWLGEDEADHMAAQRPVLHRTDDLAHKLDLRYSDRQALAIKTIGAVDVDQAERERLRRQRQNERKMEKRAKAKQETNAVTDNSPVRLTPRQRTVLEVIGDVETAVPDLVDRLAKRKVFRGASMRQRVHEALDQLRDDKGLIADRFEPSPRGKVRFVWRQQPSR
jgi:hypothetical protein